ncbi:tetratricopeptide repeat protein [Candidatus Omnitrophota bacterium]
MNHNNDDARIDKKMKDLLGNPAARKLPEAKTTEFISRLYKVPDEKKTLVDFIPVKRVSAFAGALVTLLILFVGYSYFSMPMLPVVEGIGGTVKIYRSANNEWSMAKKPGIKLAKNDIVKTFEDGQADIVVSGRYHLRLKHDSEVKLADAARRGFGGNIKYDLAKGKVYAYYKKAKGTKKVFDIETPQADVSVIGTDFMVQAMPALNRTWVGVLDGTVKVTSRDIKYREEIKDATVFVEPGEKTVVRTGRPPTLPRRLMENELLDMEELYRIGRKPQVALLISTGKTRARELLTAVPLFVSSERPGVLPEKMRKIINTFNQAIKERSREKYLENIKQYEEIVDKYPNPKYDVQFLLFIAAYYEHLGEHEKAIETFQRVVDDYPASSLASIAQCAIGIIYEENLNNSEKAKEAYQKVISNYPRSPETEEAAHGLRRLG